MTTIVRTSRPNTTTTTTTTTARHRRRRRQKTRKQTDEVKQFHIPEAGVPQSSVLDGFSLFPARQLLDAFAAAQAEANCWATEAKLVKSQKDVIRFIQSHGGTCQLTVHKGTDFFLGGKATDAMVSNLRTLIEKTDKNARPRRMPTPRLMSLACKYIK
jgi:hypothetical protein